MSRNTELYLNDVLESCEKIIRYTHRMSFAEFVEDERTYDAVIRNLQVIGEAVKNIPENIRQLYPSVEWRKIAGMRDILVHAYFSLENETIWDILQTKISPLMLTIQTISTELFEEGNAN